MGFSPGQPMVTESVMRRNLEAETQVVIPRTIWIWKNIVVILEEGITDGRIHTAADTFSIVTRNLCFCRLFDHTRIGS
jgi:hypothetical protein